MGSLPTYRGRTIVTGILLALLVTLSLHGRAAGEVRQWIGPAGGNWFTAGNWSPSGGPSPTDDLRMFTGTARASNKVIISDGGRVWLSGSGTSLTIAIPTPPLFASLYIGDTGSGWLSVMNGASVISPAAWMGNTVGSTAVATVSGANSQLTYGNYSSTALGVGYLGSAALNIEAGGQVSYHYGRIGVLAGSDGSVTVTGANSRLTTVYGLSVGEEGHGSLHVADGGMVTARNLLASLNDISGNGTIATQGAVLDGDIVFDGDHDSRTSVFFGQGGQISLDMTGPNSSVLGAGYKGNGTLTITDGEVVSSSTGYLGRYAGAVGTAVVTGAGSQWICRNDLRVGYDGSGTLTVSDGGSVRASTLYASLSDLLGDGTITATTGAVLDAELNFDASHGTQPTFGFGTGGTLHLNCDSGGTLGVGYKGVGTMRIADGRDVYSGAGQLGYCAGAIGRATISGPFTEWSTGRGRLSVGYYGNGEMTVEAGARVSDDTGILGDQAGSTGVATVKGAGSGTASQWNNTDNLYVGRSGDGTLNIEDGGRVTNSSAYVGSDAGSIGAVKVNGRNSQWNTNGALYVGDSGVGSMLVEAGGRVSCFTGNIGYRSAGAVRVTGEDSEWITSGLIIGGYGHGALRVDSSGYVVSGPGDLGRYADSSGSATVSGEGSQWRAGNLSIGKEGWGALAIEAGGKVIASDVTLGDSASAIGSASVTGGGTQWANSGALRVGVGGEGMLGIADGGQVTGRSLSINDKSAARLHVSGDNMLVLGNSATAGSVDNGGAVSFYADAFLASGTYRPISESADRPMTWTGSGSYNAVGGAWIDSSKTFVVDDAAELWAGASHVIAGGERLIATDEDSGRRMGVSFGAVAAGNFRAERMSGDALAGLALMPGYEGEVLSAWSLESDYVGGEVMLSFDIGLGQKNLCAWRLADGAWTECDPTLATYDSHGIYSFTADGFSGYAVVQTPEPATLGLLIAGGLALVTRRRK